MLRNWIFNELTAEEEKSKEELTKQLGISPTLCNLLVQRGITTYDAAKSFFRPQLTDLHDPFLLNDMDKAVNRLNAAITDKEKILVYGDYDVDGTTAVALVYTCLHQLYSNLDIYIPDRYNEGYGVSYKGIDYAAEHGISLIIVLDCGIKAIEKTAYAKSLGIDIIICDHHTPDDTLPEAVAVLDPKRTDSTYPYGHLSGCGVGFKLMQAFAQSNGLAAETYTDLLDLLAVSIASDIVPITGENRVLMTYGLARLNTRPCIGLQGIIEVCELAGKELTVSDIVFKIGPRINASGRMRSGREAVELLISKDLEQAKEKSKSIDGYNQERKDMDKETTLAAKKLIDQDPDFKTAHSVVVYDQTWHKGVIGIVASRLSEEYYRPSVVLTLSNGFATGSARSVAGFDLYKAIDSCRDLLENFGGHTYAAGLTMKVENIDAFKRRFDAYVAENLQEDQKIPSITIDTTLTLGEITPAFYKILKQFAPFGPDNPKPVFASLDVWNTGGSRMVGKNNEHLKLDVTDKSATPNITSGIGFGMGSDIFPHIKENKPFSVCYTLEENNYNGKTSLQLMLKDVKEKLP